MVDVYYKYSKVKTYQNRYVAQKNVTTVKKVLYYLFKSSCDSRSQNFL